MRGIVRRITLNLVIIVCMFNCKKVSTDEQITKTEKNYGTLYFVRYNVETPISVNCNNYLSSLGFLISYFKIDDKELIDLLLKDPEIHKFVQSNADLDIRYQIELEDKVICIDELGNYTIDNKLIGRLSRFQLFLDYIEKHRESSIKLMEDFPFVDDK